MLVADLRHFLDLPDDVPGPARRLAEHLGGLVRAATAADPGAAWLTALPCRRRPGHRRCPGRMIVRRARDDGPIEWQCNSCGDAGHVSGWEDSLSDVRDHHPRSIVGVSQFYLPTHVAETLRDLRSLPPECQRLVYRAEDHDDEVALTSTEDELEELIGNVASEAAGEPNRTRRQRLNIAVQALGNAAQTPNATPAPGVPAKGATTADKAATDLPELDVARVQRWCAARVPEHARHQVRVECDITARHLTIVERRVPWNENFGPEWTSTPIAQLRYGRSTRSWALYFTDRHLRFRAYQQLPTSPYINELLTEIGRDPAGMFWG